MATIRKTVAAPLPQVSQETAHVTAPALAQQLTYPLLSIHTRIYNPDTGGTYQLCWYETPLEVIEETIALYLEQGYKLCLSPDAPVAPPAPVEQPVTSRDAAPVATRPGQRAYKPKDDRFVLPFGKHKGDTLSTVESDDPTYVDWLAENATMPDVRKAAQKIVNQRDDDDEPS